MLYLLLTMAPFAVVAPVLGPLLDRTRGGRRLLIAARRGGRAILCLLMAGAIDELLLYPLAFAMLVLSKGHSVAKSALVPAVVDSPDELVRANSRLALIAILGGAVAAPIAAAILKLSSAAWVLRFGAVIFVVGIVAALAIPRAKQVGPPETERGPRAAARAEHRHRGFGDGAGARRRRLHHLLRGVRAQEARRAGVGLRAGAHRQRASATRSGA